MNPIALNNLKEQREILAELAGVDSYRVFLAGGCVRDAAAGLEPKDYDCIILNDTADPWDDASAFSLSERIASDCRVMGASVAIYQAYGLASSHSVSAHDLTGRTRDFDDNIWCGIHVQFGDDTPYDILLSRHSDIEHVMNSFDCNWNQQWIHESIHNYWTRQYPLTFTGKPLRDGREEYIRNKYNEVFNVHNSTGS